MSWPREAEKKDYKPDEEAGDQSRYNVIIIITLWIITLAWPGSTTTNATQNTIQWRKKGNRGESLRFEN